MKHRHVAFTLFLVLLTAGSIALAAPSKTSKVKLYKWVDKQGVTHYGSSIPPEYASQASEQINAQGQVLKTTEAQMTPEQAAAAQQAQVQAQQEADAAAARKAHDKVLLDTYTSTADMERDRDSKLSAIDAQINVLNGTVAALQNTLADLQGRANELSANNKPVPDNLQKQIEGTKQELISNQQQLLVQQQHKHDVTTQFSDDIARFKQLTSPQPAPGSGG